MDSISKANIISAWTKIGIWLQNPDEKLLTQIQNAQYKNAWFLPEMVSKAFSSIANVLDKNSLESWAENYTFATKPKSVGLILAGNIPLVGFHDLLCLSISGHHAQVKISSDDAGLSSFLIQKLIEIDPIFKKILKITERLSDFDAVIATGSNNTARYFDYYFGKVPNIIRKNRNSIAILSGNETETEIKALGNDIFDYYGLGCRNVSKIYIPKNYDLKSFYEPIESFKNVLNHHKFQNNYDYNKSIYLVNLIKHFDNGFLLLKEDEQLASPLSVLYFEYYQEESPLVEKLNLIQDRIQCVSSNLNLEISNLVPLGKTQSPKLNDYADGIDTMKFLEKI